MADPVQITQEITPLPAAPVEGSGFRARAAAFLAALVTFGTQLIAWRNQVNAVATAVNADAATATTRVGEAAGAAANAVAAAGVADAKATEATDAATAANGFRADAAAAASSATSSSAAAATTLGEVLAARDEAVEAASDAIAGGIPKSLGTAAGDLVTFSGAATPVRLPVGLAGQALLAAPGGVVWGDPPATGQCRLTLSGANLLLSRHNGRILPIDNVPQIIPAAGVTLAPTGTTAGLLYYIYAAMMDEVMALFASTTGYAFDPRNGIAVKSDDVTRTLVGLTSPITGPAWVDDSVLGIGTAIRVLSWYNRRQKTVTYLEPSYLTTTSTSFVNCGQSLTFLSWGGDVCRVEMHGVANSGTAETSAAYGLNIDGDHSKSNEPSLYLAVQYATVPVSVLYEQPLSEGMHTAQPIFKVGGNSTVYGSSADASTNGQTTLCVWG